MHALWIWDFWQVSLGHTLWTGAAMYASEQRFTSDWIMAISCFLCSTSYKLFVQPSLLYWLFWCFCCVFFSLLRFKSRKCFWWVITPSFGQVSMHQLLGGTPILNYRNTCISSGQEDEEWGDHPCYQLSELKSDEMLCPPHNIAIQLLREKGIILLQTIIA